MRRAGDSNETAPQPEWWNTVGPGNGLYWPPASPDTRVVAGETSVTDPLLLTLGPAQITHGEASKIARLRGERVSELQEINDLDELVATERDQAEAIKEISRLQMIGMGMENNELLTAATYLEESRPESIPVFTDKVAEIARVAASNVVEMDIVGAANVTPLPERPTTSDETVDPGDTTDMPGETIASSEIADDTPSVIGPAEKTAILNKKTEKRASVPREVKKATKAQQTVKKATATKVATKPKAATTVSEPVRPAKKKTSTIRLSLDEKEQHGLLLTGQARRRIERANKRDAEMSDAELFTDQSHSPEPPKYVNLALFKYFMGQTDEVPNNWTRRELSMAASVVKARPDKPPDEVVQDRIKRVQNIPPFPTARSGPRYDA